MSTRINVTVGDGGLLDRNAQQTAANRQARVLADQRATAEAEGVERRVADRTAAGLDPLTGLPASTPSSASTINRLDQEPAANRKKQLGGLHCLWIGSTYFENDFNEQRLTYYVGSTDAASWVSLDTTSSVGIGTFIDAREPDFADFEDWAVSLAPDWVDKQAVVDNVSTFTGGSGQVLFHTPNFIGSPKNFGDDPVWAASQRFASDTSSARIESSFVLPAGGDKAIVIIKRQIEFAWYVDFHAVTYEGGGTLKNKDFYIPSPWYYVPPQREYAVGVAYNGLQLTDLVVSLRPNPRGDQTQSITFVVMASSTFPQDYDFNSGGALVPGRELTGSITVTSEEDEEGNLKPVTASFTSQPESGEVIWVRMLSTNVGEQVPAIPGERSELVMTLNTGESGSIGPTSNLSSSWRDASFTYPSPQSGGDSTVDVTEAYLVSSNAVKKIPIPNFVLDTVIPRVRGKITRGQVGTGTQTFTYSTSPNSYIFSQGRDRREFTIFFTINGGLRSIERDPSLPLVTRTRLIFDPPTTLTLAQGETPYFSFPTELGIDVAQIRSTEAADRTFQSASSPAVYDAIFDRYKGTGQDAESRNAYGAPAYDLGVDPSRGAMLVSDFPTFTGGVLAAENRIREQLVKVEEMLASGFIQVVRIQGDQVSKANTITFSENAFLPEKLADTSAYFDSGRYGESEYNLNYFTDWGKPSYCKQQLLNMGFRPEDITFILGT
jgi:hypothetical protein